MIILKNHKTFGNDDNNNDDNSNRNLVRMLACWVGSLVTGKDRVNLTA